MARSPRDKKDLPDRFAPPKACLSAPAVGPASYGLPDKPSKKVLQHEHEAYTAERNMAAADAEGQVPNGRRFHAGQDYKTRLDEAREEYDDWKRPDKPAFRETLTSLDNPLRTEANDPSKGNPFYEKRGVTVVQVEQAQAPKGKRCFVRNERYGTMEQLTAGSLLPLSGTELRQARQDARLKASTSGTAGAAQQGAGGAEAEDDVGEHDQAEDQEQEEEEGAAVGQQPGAKGAPCESKDPSTFPGRDVSEAQRAKQSQTVTEAARVAEVKALEDQLLREWPHGVPKHVLLKLQRAQQLDAANVPPVGFGLPLAMGSKHTAASLRQP